MNPRQFAMLAVAAVASLVIAAAIYSASVPWSPDVASGGPLFPTLKTDLEKVSRVELKQGKTTLTIDRHDNDWRLNGTDGYPASAEKVRALLANLAEAELAEPKTKIESHYSILELEDPAGVNASSRLMRLLDDKGNVIAEAVVGKQRPASGAGKAGTYVRKPGDPQTWLVSTAIDGDMAMRDWTKGRVFEAAPEKVSKLSIQVGSDPAYEIKRDADGNHTLAEVPAGKKIKYVNSVENIVVSTALMELEDVRKAPADATADVGTAVLETDNGLKVTLKFRRDKDDIWYSLAATGEGDAKKIADELAARTNGWEFKILPSKLAGTLIKRDELLEDAAS